MTTKIHYLSYLAQFFLQWELCQTEVVEKIKTHFTFNNFFFENRAVYERMWKNIVERGRPQTTIWRMRIACWITKATNIHSHYVILIAFPLQLWFHESTIVLRHTNCTVCLVDLKIIPHITFSSCVADFQLPMQITKPIRHNGNYMYQRHEQ
jgi:hypothetical protein